MSSTILHTSIGAGDPKDILSRDDHVYWNEWMQKQQIMFQSRPNFVPNINFSNRFAIYLQYMGMSIWIDSRNASLQNFIFIVCLYWMNFSEVFRILLKTPSNIFQRKNWGWKCCQQAKKKFHWSSKMTTLEHHEFCLCVFILAISRELKRRNSWKYSTSAR